MVWNLMELLGANQKVKIGQAVEHILTTILSHTTHNAQDKMGLFAAKTREVPHLTEGLLLGLLTNAACIE